jgi:hypothetical protein
LLIAEDGAEIGAVVKVAIREETEDDAVHVIKLTKRWMKWLIQVKEDDSLEKGRLVVSLMVIVVGDAAVVADDGERRARRKTSEMKKK